MSTFQQIRALKAQGLSYSTVLVKFYLDEHGFAPVGLIADACGLSVRSVDRAIADLKQLGLLSSVSKTNLAHDHDHVDHVNNRTETVLADKVGEEDAKTDDPLREQLEAYGVLPWCIDNLLARCERPVIERQLACHAFRLEHGFKFRGHPARYLFGACLKDYAPPEGFHAKAHKVREGLLEQPRVPVAAPAPQKAPDGPRNPEETVRTMLASPVPAVRRMALKFAREWGVALPAAAAG